MLLSNKIKRNFDTTLLLVTLLLATLGVLMIYTATHLNISSGKEYLFHNQIIWLCLSLTVLTMGIIIPYRFFESLAYLSYLLSLGFLIAVLVLPSGGVRAHRWFLLGPFRFQPSELAKLTTIFALAYFLSRRGVVLKSLKDLIIPSIIAAIPCLLIIGPDLGTALVFVPILLAMLYWAGLPFIYLFLIITPMISLICAFSFIAWLIFIFLLVLVLF